MTESLSSSTSVASSRHGRSALFLLITVAIWSLFFLAQERDTLTNRYALQEPSQRRKTTNLRSNHTETIHVLLGLKGNAPGFLSEFQVALKNILLQAPLEQPMHIHIMADDEAYQAIVHESPDNKDPLHLFVPSLHQQWWSVQPVQLHIYNVETQLQKEWKPFLKHKFQSYSFQHMTNQHTVGAFFRLLAHQVLLVHDPSIEYVIYLDPDVVFLANVQAVWNERPIQNDQILFVWGASMCSGFLLLHIPRLKMFWDLTDNLDLTSVAQQYSQSPNDQLFLRAMNVTHPERVALLPPAWDINIADGMRRFAKTIVQQRPIVGMMHFNGGLNSEEPYYKVHDFLNNPDLVETWGVALYYTRMPWTWARYLAQSQILAGRPEYPLELYLYPSG